MKKYNTNYKSNILKILKIFNILNILNNISLYKILGLNIHGRYIAQTVLRFIGLITFALVGLFFIFDVLAETSEVGKGQYTLRLAALFSLLKIPAQFYDVMPIAVVAGAIVGLASLANNSEITVFRAANMPPKRLLFILFMTGLPLVLLTLGVGEWLQPLATSQADSLRAKALGYRMGGELKTGLWLRDALPNHDVQFLNIPTIDADGNAPQLLIYHFDAQMHLIERGQALRGHFQIAAPPSKNIWLFEQLTTETYHPKTGQRLAVSSEPNWRWQTGLGLNALVGLQNNPERVGIMSLLETALFQMRNDLDSKKSMAILLRRVLHPLALWVMLAIAFPFAYLRARDGAIAVRIFAGVLLGMGFHAGNRLFEFMSLVQGWPVWLTAQMPLWLGISTALILFWRFHRLH